MNKYTPKHIDELSKISKFKKSKDRDSSDCAEIQRAGNSTHRKPDQSDEKSDIAKVEKCIQGHANEKLNITETS